MSDTTAPHSAADVTTREHAEYTYFDGAVVTSALTSESGPPYVTVQETRVPADQPIPVAPTVHGDYYVPPEGTPVLVGYLGENDPIVVGTGIPDVQTPSVEAGERVLSHPLSEATVTFNADGSLDVYGDGEVRVTNKGGASVVAKSNGNVVINDGTQGAITDVSTSTTTDADGHVTSVSINLTRDSSILI